METHQWKEHRFDSFNVVTRCPVQTWRCKVCNQELDLPHGANPKDYTSDNCKKPEVKPVVKTKWKHPLKGVRT